MDTAIVGMLTSLEARGRFAPWHDDCDGDDGRSGRTVYTYHECVMLVRVRRDCACACRTTERLTSGWKPRPVFLLHLMQPLAPKLGR